MWNWFVGRRAAQLAQLELRLDDLTRLTERLSADLEHLEQLANKVRARVTGALAHRKPPAIDGDPHDLNARIAAGKYP